MTRATKRHLGVVLLMTALLIISPVTANAAEPEPGPNNPAEAEPLRPPKTPSTDATDAQELIAKARLAFQSVAKDPNMAWLRDHIREAKGVFIVPQLLKAAFFVGGSGGSGVLLVRNEKGDEWSEPAFYTLGGASFGLQFGAEASEVVVLIMTKRGVESMLSSSIKLGGDVSIAVGPVGGGVQGATANLSADLLSFSRSKGAFVGISLDGAVVATRNDWNSAYYGRDVRAPDILVSGTVHNPQTAELRAAVGQAADGK
jgi:lipid-binding SYLF domain-containing protein